MQLQKDDAAAKQTPSGIFARPESAGADSGLAQRSEEPDEQEDDQDQGDEAASDVHAVSFRSVPRSSTIADRQNTFAARTGRQRPP
jgi:hypothetical protein